MKKISLLVIFSIITVFLFAQTDGKATAEPLSDDQLALQTANSLARYGYKAQSGSALIGAAEIFARIRTQPLGVQAVRSQQSGSGTADTPEFTPAALIADARKIIGNDKTMRAWADEVQKSINTRTRGAVGGPKSAADIIYAGQTITYEVAIRGLEATWITLYGNGTSDLDLFVYDSSGRLIVGDDSYSDDAAVWVAGLLPQVIRIVVANVGNRANRFNLYID